MLLTKQHSVDEIQEN